LKSIYFFILFISTFLFVLLFIYDITVS
jgi:hypothetical protein